VAGGSGDQGAGILVDNGNFNVVTVGGSGSVSAASGTAIRYAGPGSNAAGDVLTVNNYGTITGNILLTNADGSAAGVVSNINGGTVLSPAAEARVAASPSPAGTGTLVGASLYEADVVNGGRLFVGQSGKRDATEITGSFTQSPTGFLVVDTDFNSGAADRLLVRGDAALGGTLDLQATSLRPGRALTVLTVDGAASGAITPEKSPIYGFALMQQGHDYRLSVASADFDADAMKLEGNQSKVARGLQDIWDAGGTDGCL
jgi:hypothetical protein